MDSDAASPLGRGSTSYSCHRWDLHLVWGSGAGRDHCWRGIERCVIGQEHIHVILGRLGVPFTGISA